VVLIFRWVKNKASNYFITSKAEYALKAFDYDATDYLQNRLL
jgi:DNA-binding LytR/AlgR family response regulator